MPEIAARCHPKIFISYSHDSGEHKRRVLGLSQRLRADGFETMIDQYVEGTPPQGWARWTLNQLDWAEYVLLVCTEAYYRRFRGHELSEMGKGVDWEGAAIINYLYGQKSVSTKFVPILFDNADKRFIPEPLPAFGYALTSDAAYTDLIDHLSGRKAIEPAKLGPPPDRTRKTGAPIQFDESVPAKTTEAGPVSASVDLSALRAPGGALAADDKFYIERGADRRAQAAAGLRCETIVIKGPRQFGKTSLLARYLALSRAKGKAVASVDFSMFEEGVISNYGHFLATLAEQLARRLSQAVPLAGTIWTQQDFLLFLEATLLPALKGPVVFAFDETDRILRQGYAQDFFSMVRMWHNERVDPVLEWHKLGLVLASSTEPKLFIKDALRSPFNVGLRLPLDPFTLEEAAELNRRYGAPLSDVDSAKLHRLVGGHPFLTQEAFYKLCGPDPISFKKLEANAAKDDGPFGEHLRAMLSNVQAVEGLLAALKQAIKHGTVPRQDDFYRLEGAGLLWREDGRIVPASQIYAAFFQEV